MDTQALKALIDLFGRAPLRELEISEGGQTVKITRAKQAQAFLPPASPLPATAPAAATTPPSPTEAAEAAEVSSTKELLITAPMYGTLHLSPAPDAPPFVAVGDTLHAGQQVGLIEAMKVFTPIKTEISGRVEAILVPDGSEVEAHQPLIRLS
ncbi:acetyl-CoA carboxylase biotin carboxyl carrier protein subunit [Acetobacter pasteurianus]|uniref:Biotin carboxyl carrier protein of acetyl-CoA carboxylase n=1 Tax=Acetobacter pasteurianus TaxID=438 RepID=A0A1A0CX48_ACEPA|nr:biotin/lipoyl-containing protein [Acetobacter pasteurianus]OAZ67370.1 Biotin carboxyl carrier protein of acetyl-CoA carboxylase [Acetobacter pasteurianus]RCL06236.1 acetyl-CoA carboxylase biotin carboxyl carrier protein subunit [Acetobacter pasteurianus]GAB31351.1 acetyl-CoA carboxylase biotin carboxyl carrier protein [Acetobacter pasteurianus subsp. pasteurianus LMG 1262 = NBRC 106471]GCD50394.1 acetyl-CoA carboxylase biotin carboxyl carrier protein [Acetobacter pasteurianus subsp. pasteuri